METAPLVAGLQAAAGLVAAAAPGPVGRAAAGSGTVPPGWVVRALGGRMALQGAVLSRYGRASARRPAFLAGALIDGLHATTMVAAVFAFGGRYRRSAAISAAAAFTAGGLEVLSALGPAA